MNIPAAKVVISNIHDGLLPELEKILWSGKLTNGETVKQFEKEFAQLCGTKYAVAVNSGTTAIEAMVRAVHPESVAIPANTFGATASAVIHAGATPVFVDVNQKNMMMNPKALAKILPFVQAVVLVHIGGWISPDVDEIAEMCWRHNVVLLEDAAHAHGVSITRASTNDIINDKSFRAMAGSIGKAAAFSFFPTKIMTSCEGGLVTTDSEHLYRKIVLMRNHGLGGQDGATHMMLGSNWRMSELHAAVGLHHLSYLEATIAARKEIASFYQEQLGSELDFMSVKDCTPNWYKCVAFTDRKMVEKITALCRENGVMLSGKVYGKPLNRHLAFGRYAIGRRFTTADRMCRTHLCLPLWYGMTDEESDCVVHAIRQAMTQPQT